MDDLRRPPALKDKIKKRQFNLFFLMTHGGAIPEKEGPDFKIPTNTVLVQTGGGGTFGCATSTSYNTSLFSRFKLSELEPTFGKFLGERGNEADDTLDPLLFNTPGETALDKYVSLKDSDLTSSDGAWGIFTLNKLTGNLEEDSYLTERLIENSKLRSGKYRQSELIGLINKVFVVDGTKTINIIVSINCIVASKRESVNQYIRSYKRAGLKTHFSVGEEKSGEESVTVHPRSRYDPTLQAEIATRSASRHNSTTSAVSPGNFGEGNGEIYYPQENIEKDANNAAFNPGIHTIKKVARRVGLGSVAEALAEWARAENGGSSNNNNNTTGTGAGAGPYRKTRGGRRSRRRQTRRFRR